MERKDIPMHLKKVNARIAILEAKKAPRYETDNKYIPNMGYVEELPTKRDCAKALAFIKNRCASELESARELGLKDSDVEADVTYLGYLPEVWKSDIQKRVDTINDEELLEKLKNAREVLMKYRSKEDIAMENIEYITETLNRIAA